MLPTDWSNPLEKPSDCTCNYPDEIARNISGHAITCPAHKRICDELFRHLHGTGPKTPPDQPKD